MDDDSITVEFEGPKRRLVLGGHVLRLRSSNHNVDKLIDFKSKSGYKKVTPLVLVRIIPLVHARKCCGTIYRCGTVSLGESIKTNKRQSGGQLRRTVVQTVQ